MIPCITINISCTHRVRCFVGGGVGLWRLVCKYLCVGVCVCVCDLIGKTSKFSEKT